MTKVVIIDYGAGNIFSVQKAFERLGVKTTLSNDLEMIKNASHVIFPGVGHAALAMKQLKSFKIDELIPTLKQPVLGICLGMQLMCKHSEEGDTAGLGIFDTKVKEFSAQEIVPHMGWNNTEFSSNNSLSGAYYFVHSFYAELCENTWSETQYEHSFSASLKKDNFLGVQFHPEKSGKLGNDFLNEFLKL